MGNTVSDSTTIVYIAKVGKLQLLKRLYGDVVLPEAVKRKVLAGEHPEVPVIRAAFQTGWLEERALALVEKAKEGKAA